jgi:hypothetical protein
VKDDLIDRLHDGAVDDEQARDAQALLAKEPRAAARLERLRLLGELVREVEAARNLPADFTDRVMDRVAASGVVPRVRPRARVFAGAMAGSGLALAAAVLLWLSNQAPREAPSLAPRGPEVTASAWPEPSVESADAVALAAVDAPPVSIESVDFGTTQGAIFLVSAGATDTMVVWTMDEPSPRSGSRR